MAVATERGRGGIREARGGGVQLFGVILGGGEVGSSDGVVDRGGRRRSWMNTTMPGTSHPGEDVIPIVMLWRV